MCVRVKCESEREKDLNDEIFKLIKVVIVLMTIIKI